VEKVVAEREILAGEMEKQAQSRKEVNAMLEQMSENLDEEYKKVEVETEKATEKWNVAMDSYRSSVHVDEIEHQGATITKQIDALKAAVAANQFDLARNIAALRACPPQKESPTSCDSLDRKIASLRAAQADTDSHMATAKKKVTEVLRLLGKD